MSRWIDADALIEAMGEEPYVWNDELEEIAERNQWLTDMHIIENAPSIDIVRCKECKWHHYDTDDECRWRIEEIPKDDDFCSRGEIAEQTEPQTDCAWK